MPMRYGVGRGPRWGSVILAALGLRAAAVRRRGATLAALVLGGWLLAAEAVLARLSFMDDGPLPGSRRGRPRGGRRGAGVADLRPPGAARCPGGGRRTACARRDRGGGGGVRTPPDHQCPHHVQRAVPGRGVRGSSWVSCPPRSLRWRRSRRRRPVADRSAPLLVAALAVLPVAVVAAGGVATTATGMDQGVTLLVGEVGAGLLAVGAAALALAGRSPHGGADQAGWLSPPCWRRSCWRRSRSTQRSCPASCCGPSAGPRHPYSVAISFQPGVLLVVVPAAAALARWMLRDDPSAAASVPGSACPPGLT